MTHMEGQEKIIKQVIAYLKVVIKLIDCISIYRNKWPPWKSQVSSEIKILLLDNIPDNIPNMIFFNDWRNSQKLALLSNIFKIYYLNISHYVT